MSQRTVKTPNPRARALGLVAYVEDHHVGISWHAGVLRRRDVAQLDRQAACMHHHRDVEAAEKCALRLLGRTIRRLMRESIVDRGRVLYPDDRDGSFFFDCDAPACNETSPPASSWDEAATFAREAGWSLDTDARCPSCPRTALGGAPHRSIDLGRVVAGESDDPFEPELGS